jgi:hypothetical protein
MDGCAHAKAKTGGGTLAQGRAQNPAPKSIFCDNTSSSLLTSRPPSNNFSNGQSCDF